MLDPRLIALSAVDRPALLEQLAALQAASADPERLRAFVRRAHAEPARGPERLVLLLGEHELGELIARARAGSPHPAIVRGRAETGVRVAFVFSGQGAQYSGMARALYDGVPAYRAALERCAERLAGQLEHPLVELLFDSRHGAALGQTANTQPALFAVEYALLELWRSHGVQPHAVLGHSVGEYAAACAAGVLSVEHALDLVAARGQLLQALPSGGAMAAMRSSSSALGEALASSPGLEIAALNGPDNTVVAGPAGELREFLRRCADAGLRGTPLNVSHAFHSALMEPALEAFASRAARCSFAAPAIPMASNVTGELQRAAPDAAYWAQHVRRAVQFERGVHALLGEGCELFLELGPGTTLCALGEQIAPHAQWLPSLRPRGNDLRSLAEAAARLFARGVDVDFGAWGAPAQRAEAAPRSPAVAVATAEPIAVIAFEGRFPGAASAARLWDVLESGSDQVRELPESRWPRASFVSDDPDDVTRSYARWGALLPDLEAFDPAPFGMEALEAAALHPQQRLLLELALHTFEHGGYPEAPRATGVFLGGRMPTEMLTYRETVGRAPRAKVGLPLERAALLGRSQNFLACWIADRFDLRGPAFVVDSACSSSLLALHLACQSLRAGECEQALTGGVDLIQDQDLLVLLGRVRALSPDGKCHTFDRRANGYVMGEGGGLLLLKPLSKARRDGDAIHGLIRGSFANNDGRTMGVTTPSLDAQVELLRECYGRSAIDPRTVSYIEAHGTGTMIGDPIELKALTRVFGRDPAQTGWCGIGSLKSNIGHLHSAAGVAGLIKILLCFRHRALPASIHCAEPNPRFAFERSPFYPVRALHPWQLDARHGGARRAGISGFALGGTNVHCVLEEAPNRAPAAAAALGGGVHVLALSARSPAGLRATAERFAAYLEQASDPIADIAASSTQRRAHHAYRVAVVGASLAEWRSALLRLDLERVQPVSAAARAALACPPGEGPGAAAACGPATLRALDAAERAAGLQGDGVHPDVAQARAVLERVCRLHVHGVAVDWASFQPAGAYVPLPPSALSPVRCVLAEQLQGGRAEGMLERAERTAEGAVRFRAEVPADMPFIAQHHLFGARVLPGVYWLELVRAAAERALGRSPARFTRVQWTSPLALAPGETAHVEGTIAADGRFELRSSELHVKGQIEFEPRAAEAEPLSVAELAEFAALAPRASADAYQPFRAAGYFHGPIFRNLSWVASRGDDERVGKLERSARGASYASLVLDPGALDSATLVAFGARDFALMASISGLFVPFSVQRVEIAGACPERGYVHARVHAWSREACRATLRIVDEAGRTRVVLQDLTYKRVPDAAIERLPGAQLRCGTAAGCAVLSAERWDAVASEQPLRGDAPFATLGVLGGGPVLVRELVAASAARVVPLQSRASSDEALREAVGALPPESALIVAGDEPTAAEPEPERVLQLLRTLIGSRVSRVLVLTRGALAAGSAESPAIAGAALAALLRVARLELPQLKPGLVDVELSATPAQCAAAIVAELARPADTAVAWRAGGRLLRRFEPAAQLLGPVPIAPGAACVIVGGLGGLGTQLCSALCERVDARVALISRGARPESAEALRAAGYAVRAFACDASDRAALERALQRVRAELGPIRVVIHSAAVSADGLIATATAESYRRACAAKLDIARNLDALTADDPLDHFVLFSSLSAVLGNAGQAAYAAANAQVGAFGSQRARTPGRRGKTTVIDWTAWQGVGLAADPGLVADLRRRGIEPIAAAAGVNAFFAALQSVEERVLVTAGAPVELDAARAVASAPPAPAQAALAGALQVDEEAVLRWIASMCRHERPLLADAQFLDQGLDSAALVEASERMQAAAGVELYPTLFFEYPTPRQLAAFLREQHGAALARSWSATAEDAASVEPPALSPAAEAAAVRSASSVLPEAPAGAPQLPEADRAVAVIGMAGRYPGAEDLDALWQVLIAGQCQIAPVPGDRWSARGEGPQRFGAWLSDVRSFDAELFGLDAEECRRLDPQLRLVLETAVETLEDAGYAGEATRGRRVGVFVGYGHDHYYQERRRAGGDPLLGVSLETAVANRVSFHMDWHGPSVTVNTLCSSALVALHAARSALERGECELALVAAVHCALSAEYYDAMASLGAISPSGRSQVFCASADGYVPGEGVGAVLLKPLARALADRDHVRGVLRGSAVLHAGRASRFDAPDLATQAEVVKAALAAARLSAAQLDHVEVHAVGSMLGDAIELRALDKAFAEAGEPCSIGSAKPLFGHLESASGMLALHKVLLSLQHGVLPPTPLAGDLAPGLVRAHGPLELLTEARAWPARAGDAHARGGQPRRAGISAFGMFGVYAHAIVEEAARQAAPNDSAGSWPLLLSAPDQAALRELASRLAAVFERREAALVDVAHTLACGRFARSARALVLASSAQQAIDGLSALARGVQAAAPAPLDPALESLVRPWLGGGAVDFAPLFAGIHAGRVSLPRAAFRRKPYWVSAPVSAMKSGAPAPAPPAASPPPSAVANAEREFVQVIERALGRTIADRSRSFLELGADSLLLGRIAGVLSERLGRELAPVMLFEFPTPALLWAELAPRWPAASAPKPAALLSAQLRRAGLTLLEQLRRLEPGSTDVRPAAERAPDSDHPRELLAWVQSLTVRADAAAAALRKARSAAGRGWNDLS